MECLLKKTLHFDIGTQNCRNSGMDKTSCKTRFCGARVFKVLTMKHNIPGSSQARDLSYNDIFPLSYFTSVTVSHLYSQFSGRDEKYSPKKWRTHTHTHTIPSPMTVPPHPIQPSSPLTASLHIGWSVTAQWHGGDLSPNNNPQHIINHIGAASEKKKEKQRGETATQRRSKQRERSLAPPRSIF